MKLDASDKYMNQETTPYDIQNIVFSGKFTIDDKLNTDELEKSIDGSYKKPTFPALVYKEKGFSNTILLYNSGTFICTGNKTIDDGIRFIQSFTKKLTSNGVAIHGITHEIVNIVATGDFTLMIDLESTALELENVQYEPEVFPGLIYRPGPMPNNGLAPVFLFFKKGKFVCTKLKDIDMIQKWVDHARRELVDKGLYLEATTYQ